VLHQQGLLPAETNFSPVAPLGWALVVEEPWEAVDNPLLRQTQAAPLVLVPALIVALIALGFGIRKSFNH